MTPTNFLEVSPELAKKRGIASGRWLHVTLRNGNLRLRALVTDRVSGKQLYMPMNSVEEPVNRLTNNHIDRAMHTPAFEGGSGEDYSPSGAGRESTGDDKSLTGARQMAPSLNFKPNPLQLNSAFNSRIP